MKILLLIIFIASCATQKENSSKSVEEIKNVDFKPKKEKPYIKARDKNRFEDKKIQKSSLLAIESLDKGRLYEESIVVDDLDKLTQSCYESEFAEAKEMIRSLQNEYRSNIIFWNQVATCFMLEKEYRKALLFYNKALEFNPAYAPVLNNVGVMYERKGEDEKAMISYQKAISKNRYARTPKYNLALLYLKYNLSSKASKILKGLAQLNPSDADVQNALATSYLMNKNIQMSLGTFGKINKNHFEEARFGINYAYALSLNKQKKKSIDIFEDIDIDKKSKYRAYYSKVKSLLGVK